MGSQAGHAEQSPGGKATLWTEKKPGTADACLSGGMPAPDTEDSPSQLGLGKHLDSSCRHASSPITASAVQQGPLEAGSSASMNMLLLSWKTPLLYPVRSPGARMWASLCPFFFCPQVRPRPHGGASVRCSSTSLCRARGTKSPQTQA